SDLQIDNLDATTFEGASPAGIRWLDFRTAAARPEEVLIQLNPEEFERIRTVVRVSNGFRARNRLGRRVERHFDVVVRSLLPVGGAGLAGGRAILVWGRQIQLLECISLRRHLALCCSGQRKKKEGGDTCRACANGQGTNDRHANSHDAEEMGKRIADPDWDRTL